MKAILGILAFFFFLLVLILMLTGGYILRTIRKMRNAAIKAAEQQEHLYREETARQRHQYTHEAHKSYKPNETNGSYESHESQETIIDHRHQSRSDRKIFDDSDGEYIDFEEA
jgi:ABC-type nickel/cobalt efflux system permease component RcnA